MEKQGLFKKCLSNKSVPTWPTLDTLEEIKWTSSKCQTIGIIWNRKIVGEKSRRSTNPLCLDAILKGLSTTSSSRAVMGPRIYQSHKKWIVADACGFGVLQTGHFIYWLLDKTHLDHSWSIPRDVVHKFNSPLMHLQAGTKWAPLGWLMQHSTLSDVNVLPKLVRHLVTSSWPNLVAMFTTLA
jgi:hypothetical protein